MTDAEVYRLNTHGEIIGRWPTKTACARDFGCDPQAILKVMDGS